MPLLRPGDTCWRLETATRAAFLIDYQAYYGAVLEALAGARRSVFILGWSFDPRARLRPDGANVADAPDAIGRILIELAEERPELQIRVLAWRSSFAIAASQEFFPHRAKGYFKDSRVDFHLDDQVPFGACHHQKALIIDDRIAFTGSGDIAVDRWDSLAHLDADTRRRMPSGKMHGARHEVMMLSEGPVAEALGALARERWLRATGEALPPPDPGESAWPSRLAADLTDVPIAISRTEPAWKRPQSVEEISRLTVAAIAEAKESLYLENQYFTAPEVAEALAHRLGEPAGPEVLLVSTGQSPSWFDRLTMDRARAALIWRLKAADIFGRFRALRPVTADGVNVIVHSKVTIVDDRFARIGSANLNNRSGGFDTECDLTFEATTDAHRSAITTFRDTLFGHFVARSAADVAVSRQRHGGLIGAVDAMNRDRLVPIEPPRMGPFGEFVAAHHLGDPATVSDSWRPLRRRETLYDRVRQADREISTTKGK